MNEKPLVGWKNIAKHLEVSEKTAKKMLIDAPFLPDYKGIKAIFPSDLNDFLRKGMKITR